MWNPWVPTLSTILCAVYARYVKPQKYCIPLLLKSIQWHLSIIFRFPHSYRKNWCCPRLPLISTKIPSAAGPRPHGTCAFSAPEDPPGTIRPEEREWLCRECARWRLQFYPRRRAFCITPPPTASTSREQKYEMTQSLVGRRAREVWSSATVQGSARAVLECVWRHHSEGDLFQK